MSNRFICVETKPRHVNMRTTVFLILVLLLLVPAASAEDALEWYTRGQSAAMAGNHDLAITYYNNALALDPDYASALAGKAASQNAKRDYANALSTANEALKIKAKDPVSLNARAFALFGMGDYDAAAEAYDNLFEVQINNVNAYCNQGYAYLQTEDYEKAIVAYDRCTKMDPLNIMSWNNMGLAYMATGKYDQALTVYDKATAVTTKNATIWNNKGLALAALDRPADALQCFYKALGIDPDYNEAQKNKEDVMGKQQSFTIHGTITPEPTISRIGTYWTTVPTATVSSEPAGVSGVAIPSGSVTLPSTTPVPKRTTYAPISPITILGALGTAACAGFCLLRK